jgi:eukaryotic-like serine/threonine-protein kinase
MPDKKNSNGYAPANSAVLDAGALDFLLKTKLLKALPTEAVEPLLRCLVLREIQAGERFIHQGQAEDSLFVIQEGVCALSRKHNGRVEAVEHSLESAVVGEMALLTGEPRSANVDALTNMKLWELKREDFDRVSEEHPDLREFLFELLTNRLEKSPVIAARNVGRYTMTHYLNKGGWSFVYQGKHRVLNIPVAIKMLRHNLAMDEEFLEKFRREGRIIAKMNHRNIVHIFDIEESYRTIFIIMELLDGESLKDIIDRSGALPYNRALDLLGQIALGLDYAHQKGIVHQDIKPSNILLVPDDHIKILDFGLACSKGEEGLDVLGTPHFMAPEQIEGDPVDERTDIYSLGITAYEMFTGERPYAKNTVTEIISKHLREDIPDPGLIKPDLPPELRRLIVRATRCDPAQRYQDMPQVLEQLESLAEASRGEARQPAAKSKVTVLLISHREEQQMALNQLLDEFSARAQELGMNLSVTGQSEV